MDRSPGFGSTVYNSRPIKTRFRSGSGFNPLTLLHTVTRRLITQKPRCQAFHHRNDGIALQRLVGARLQVLFHSPNRGVFSLGRWSSQVPTGFLESRGTQELCKRVAFFSHTGLSPSVALFSNKFALKMRFVTLRSVRSRIKHSPTTP